MGINYNHFRSTLTQTTPVWADELEATNQQLIVSRINSVDFGKLYGVGRVAEVFFNNSRKSFWMTKQEFHLIWMRDHTIATAAAAYICIANDA